ncbi:MAG: pyrroline-5-carboxylate reductase [Clostridiales bacterium]|jgi:pyrroline-5-carboxylate reductase|nr:pyrroline-5-carboxylate reductase [Clostridiales bacterium]
MINKKFAFIGVGNMAGAIIKGMETLSIPYENVCLFDTDEKKHQRFPNTYRKADSVQDAAAFADIIILAVKPQVLSIPLEDIKNSGIKLDGKLIVSIVTGKTMQSICEAIGKRDLGVVRTMPNTPMLIGRGVIALTRNEYVSDESYDDVKRLFGALGSAFELEEERMNDIIAYTSSSPAYVFHFIKSMIDNAEKHGFDRSYIKNIICDAVIGSVELLKNSELSEDELIRMVCSPGGTTLAAMNELYEGKFAETLDRAMDACTKRAYELSEIKDK